MTDVPTPDLTLVDLRQLCDQYVPIASRMRFSLDPCAPAWWYAHELGHLLTVDHASIGQPLFGLFEERNPPSERWLCEMMDYELAAMDVSRQLLVTAGREDLADDEYQETDHTTIARMDMDGGRVQDILNACHCTVMPVTRAGLEHMCREALARPIGQRTPWCATSSAVVAT